MIFQTSQRQKKRRKIRQQSKLSLHRLLDTRRVHTMRAADDRLTQAVATEQQFELEPHLTLLSSHPVTEAYAHLRRVRLRSTLRRLHFR